MEHKKAIIYSVHKNKVYAFGVYEKEKSYMSRDGRNGGAAFGFKTVLRKADGWATTPEAAIEKALNETNNRVNVLFVKLNDAMTELKQLLSLRDNIIVEGTKKAET